MVQGPEPVRILFEFFLNTFSINIFFVLGEYINEDGELALAYETQKTINKQLELELQDELAKYKAHEKEYKMEIEKLRDDNERQQRLLADNLHVTPQSKSEAYMQHEITRLTKENLDLQDKCDTAADNIRKLKRQIKLLMKKLKDSGFDIDATMNDLNIPEDSVHKHGRVPPSIRKKDRDYMGMFSFKSGDESAVMKQLVIGASNTNCNRFDLYLYLWFLWCRFETSDSSNTSTWSPSVYCIYVH